MTATNTPAPPATAAPALPDVPSTTPPLLVKAVALLVFLAGPALAFLGKYGILVKLPTVTAQVIIILAFLFVAFVIFTVDEVIQNVHKYGWTKTAATQIGADEAAELRQLISEGHLVLNQAPDLLGQIRQVAPAASTLVEKFTNLEQTVKSSTQNVDLGVAAQLVDALAGQTILKAGGGVIEVPAKPVAPVATDAPPPASAAPTPATPTSAASVPQPAPATASTPLPPSSPTPAV